MAISGLSCVSRGMCILINAYNGIAKPHNILKSHKEVAFYVKFSSWSSKATSAFIY